MVLMTGNPSSSSSARQQPANSATSKISRVRRPSRALERAAQANALEHRVYAACGMHMNLENGTLRCGYLCAAHIVDLDRIASQVWIQLATLLRCKPRTFHRNWQQRTGYIRDYVERVDVSESRTITISWISIVDRLQNYLDAAKKAGPPRRWNMIRHADPSGVSGTGLVALIEEVPNGPCFMQWLSITPSINTYRSLADVADIHGHDGATELREAESPVQDTFPGITTCNDKTPT